MQDPYGMEPPFDLVKLRSDEEKAGSLTEVDQLLTLMKHSNLSDVL